MAYWNKECECMDEGERRKLQSERLVRLVERIYNNVPHYRAKMDSIGLLPGDIKSVEDLSKLPFTVKQDIRDTYPYGMFAAPMSEIVRIHASSGTTGKQTVVGYTKNDLEMWSECMARALTGAGADKDSIIQIAYGYGLFTGGFGVHYGAEKIGAAVIPASSGNTSRQITILQDFGTTFLCCTPSYALYLAEEIANAGIKKEDLKLKAGVFGAEPWTEEMRTEIQNKLGIKAYDIYGLSEIMGPSVACECEERHGMHIQEDHFIVEIINPETGEVLPDGEKGEVVFTTITKEGFPLIRYRTRDISRIIPGKCACGRTTRRLDKFSGRTDDMLIIRGVNVFPSQIESVLLEMGETAPHYEILVDRVANHDNMEVHVEMTPAFFSDSVKNIELTEKKIAGRLASVLGISAKVVLVEPKSIERSEGKAKRIIDKRKLN